jgi:hypothetical protein
MVIDQEDLELLDQFLYQLFVVYYVVWEFFIIISIKEEKFNYLDFYKDLPVDQTLMDLMLMEEITLKAVTILKESRHHLITIPQVNKVIITTIITSIILTFD